MSQRWACLFIYYPVPENKIDELRSVIVDADVIFFVANYTHALEAMKQVTDVLKGKTLVLWREFVSMQLVEERIAELVRFIDEIGIYADRTIIHLPRHRLVFEPIAKFETIRSGIVIPYVLVMQFDYKRELRFIHYQFGEKFWKGSDIVDKLKHLPHIIVGRGEGAIGVSFCDVLALQASSELLLHPTRIDSFSRFILHGIMLGCVPVLMMTDAELPFVYANSRCADKLEAFKILEKYFPIAVDENSFISIVNRLFQCRDEIYCYRERLREFLLHNPDLWCPQVIYEEFARYDLYMPADLLPVSRLTAIREIGKEAFPSGPWSENEESIVFIV